MTNEKLAINEKNNTNIHSTSNEECEKVRSAKEEIITFSERLKLATKSANVGIWEYNLVENSLIWDDAMYSLYGITKETFSGAYEAWEKVLHPDDLEKSRRHLNDAIEGIRDFNPEFRVVWQDGSIHFIKANAVVVKDDDGTPIRVYGTNWDITEQIESAQEAAYQIQLQDILMNIASKYINISLDLVDETIHKSLEELGRFVKADRTYIFEYNFENNICNNTFEWCEDDIAPQIDELQNVSLEFIPQWVNSHKSGKAMHVPDVLALDDSDGLRAILEPQNIKSMIAIPMISEKSCVGFVGFDSVKKHHDYSDKEKKLLTLFANMLVNIKMRSSLERDMKLAREEAEAANIAKSNFLANMSHEIRTPMSGIMGFLELLQTSNLTLEQNEFISEAKSASEILLYLINDILDLSKIEAGKIELEIIEFSIRSIIEDSVSLFAPKAEVKNLKLSTMINSNVPKYVLGDSSRIRQILSNLISNAIKFTENGEISVIVDSTENENNIATITFKVIDTGIGISSDTIKHLFQSFNQADTSTTRKYGGTGLGLAISKELIKLMNGEISVESIPDKGSTFEFFIPFEIAKTNEENSSVGANLQGINLLIIDDNKNNRDIITSYLKELGVSIFESTDKGSAINTIIGNLNTTNKIDIALINYNMPNINGYEIASTIKNLKIAKDMKLILITPTSQMGYGTDANQHGFDNYLLTPIKRDDLINSVANALGIGFNDEISNKESIISEETLLKNNFNPRILLVEDNQMNITLVTKMLKYKGLSCDIAKNGKEGYHAVQKKRYDMVFMDCQMPIMDGYESTSNIRSYEGHDRHTTIIAMTANAMSGDREKAIQAGMDDYISKPIDYKRMFELIVQYTKDRADNSRILKLFKDNIDKFTIDIGISKEDANEIYEDFIENFDDIINKLQDSIEKNDFKGLAGLAHQLKGTSSNLRIDSIYELSKDLEIRAKNEDKIECLKLFTKLSTIFN